MSQYPFPHDGPVYRVFDHVFEIAYYHRQGRKYRRVRDTRSQEWEDTKETGVDTDTFWCIVKLVEMRRRHAT